MGEPEIIKADEDIKVLFVKAASFPDWIMDAYRKLHSLVQVWDDRRVFWISFPENGAIGYRAAA
ncbi:MAG: hypothetical protein ACD_2C00210G0014 [uncultured bacterium (gcode 4)]|uniref:Uncharacterized protein n=1 Tax=uncultured bacterium (gcode 4) TaxID=1234023 RepID=K2FDM5_9BACT|nr:MAG: hypothetical protein ACD_2C00210G0014 [uncultured bacterium (gcode 4)]